MNAAELVKLQLSILNTPVMAKNLAHYVGLDLASVAATCSKLHKAGEIRAESIWVKDDGGRLRPKLHYYSKDKK